MDPFHYHPQPQPQPHSKHPQEEKCNNTSKAHLQNNTSNSYLCRQTSTRWIPTSEQIRILRDLYYNHGMRSPNSEEIQRISTILRQYGKIEGKNVFYWFQNHKARERQKKRLTVDVNGVGMKPNDNGCSGTNLVSPGALTPNAGLAPPSSFAYLYNVASAENSVCTGPMLTERNLNIEYNDMNGHGDVLQIQNINGGLEVEIHPVQKEVEIHTAPWQATPHAEQSAATIAVTRGLETLQLFPVKSVPEPSNKKVHLHSQQEPSFPFPEFPSSFSCCNSSLYSQQVQLQQNQLENQCTYSHPQPTTTSLELTLGSYFFSPPYPGPM